MSAQTATTERGGKRPWLAAALAVFHPGLGHLYLREWLRAILWFGTVLLATSLLVPPEAADAMWDAMVSLDVAALTEASRAIPTEATAALLALTVLNVFDAYWLAKSTHSREATGEATTQCPHCGKELDEDLDFCHWCTTQLDVPEESAE